MSWRRRVLALLIRPAVVRRQGQPLSAVIADHQLQDVIGWWKRSPLRSLSTPSYQSYQRPASVKKQGIAHVQTTFSNTVITVTDLNGDAKSWASSGSVGFKGCKRASKFAAQAAAEHVAKQAVQLGYGSVEVRLKGATGFPRNVGFRVQQTCPLSFSSPGCRDLLATMDRHSGGPGVLLCSWMLFQTADSKHLNKTVLRLLAS